MTSSGTEKEGHVESKNTYKPHHSFTVLNDSDSGKVYSQPETPVHELEAFPQVDASQEDEAPPEQLEAKHKVLIVLSLCVGVFYPRLMLS